MNAFQKLLSTLALSTFALGAAASTEVVYVFSLNWQSGPLAGSESKGALSFDSGLAVPNAEYYEPNMLVSFDISVNGIDYDVTDISTGFMTFDADGDLRLLGVGTNCGPGYCSSTFSDPPSLYLVYDSQSELDRFFAVAGPPDASQSYGTGQINLSPVPEASSALMLALGLAAIRLARRGASSPIS